MSFPHLPPWPVNATTQSRTRDWENVSACELADNFAGYDAVAVVREPVTFDAVTLRYYELVMLANGQDLDLFLGLEREGPSI